MFEILEAHDGLDINSDAHIWLLHHLFLSAINTDATVWTETWNNHTLARRSRSTVRQLTCTYMVWFKMAYEECN